MYRLLVAPHSAIASNFQTTCCCLSFPCLRKHYDPNHPFYYASCLGESLFLVFFYSTCLSLLRAELFNGVLPKVTPRYHSLPFVNFHIWLPCMFLGTFKSILIVFKSVKSARKSKKSTRSCFSKQWDLLNKVVT